MIREVTTITGTVYLIDPEAATVVRLVDHAGALRRDGEAIRLLETPHPQVGEAMVLLLDLRRDGVVTVRMTTPVVNITVVTPVTGRNAQ
jgi:hypothetical protein